jgi:hypothetical protein
MLLREPGALIELGLRQDDRRRRDRGLGRDQGGRTELGEDLLLGQFRRHRRLVVRVSPSKAMWGR